MKKGRNKFLLTIVVPCYNEEKCLHIFYEALISEYKKHSNLCDLEIIFVNDGSSDNTQQIINLLSKEDGRVSSIQFSRNFGKEAALTAGIKQSSGDALVPMDADLQHPPRVVFDLLNRFLEGDVDVVIAKRNSRSTESKLYKVLTWVLYWIQNKILRCKIPENLGDFRLISKEVAEALSALPESQRYMKGLYAWVGFKSCVIHYEVAERCGGDSKFTPGKLISLALSGICDFSNIPLRLSGMFGCLCAFASILYGIYIFVRTLIYGSDLPGYASIIFGILFLGGIQLIAIGILGEYLGRVYTEVKKRPTYIIKKDDTNQQNKYN